MSRIGLKPIDIPEKVDVSVDNTNTVTVKGPNGELSQQLPAMFKIEQEGNVMHVVRPDDEKKTRSMHGLYRTLIANMLEGVTTGYTKKMHIEGSGYRAQKQGKTLVMNLGFSHQVQMTDPDGITTEVPDDRTIIVKGADKQQVGNYAANIRKWRLPEPYKGKGILFEGEQVRRKEGKTGK